MNDPQKSTMSKKAAILGMAITAIGSSDNHAAMGIIALVAIVGVVCQLIHDLKLEDRG